MIKIDGGNISVEGKGGDVLADLGGLWSILKKHPEFYAGMRILIIPAIMEDKDTTPKQREFLSKLQALMSEYPDIFEPEKEAK